MKRSILLFQVHTPNDTEFLTGVFIKQNVRFTASIHDFPLTLFGFGFPRYTCHEDRKGPRLVRFDSRGAINTHGLKEK